MATQPLAAVDRPWPAMSLAAVEALLTAPGARFEMETITIRGVPTRVWKNAPPSMRALVMLSRTHGERLVTIHEDERVSYDAQFRAIATLAADLRAHGVVKGDRVAIAMRNLPEWPVAFFAATVIGAVAVPLNAWWTGGRTGLWAGGFGRVGAGLRRRTLGADRRAPRAAPRPRPRAGLARFRSDR